MNYELAKELKNAGFLHFHTEECTPEYCLPTLSELIEACGSNYISIEERSPENEDWVAYKRNLPNGGESHYGQTPEEAVARLWLVLNKKA